MSGDLPKHIAIIMDGNGRWAKKKGLPRILGHRAGVNKVKKIVRFCGNIGISYLTLFAFSTENWQRPITEISALMKLLVEYLKKEVDELDDNNVKFVFLGDRSPLPDMVQPALDHAIHKTEGNTGLNLQLAINYSGRQEIIFATRQLARLCASGELEPECIDEKLFSENLFLPAVPDPDLLIRTSGEIRISNFLLWQLAYSELVFVDKLWPDFSEDDLMAAVTEFHTRERRFGKTSTIVQ